ncbi:MAG: hypothetical protein FWC24_06955 [Treponema sp.]|nr:hypothetical protein [Treponema sp.]
MINGRNVKIALVCAVLCIGIAFPVFSQMPEIKDLSTSMDKFAEKLATTLPFNASMGLNWSNAYIGKFFPSLPPHFGIGISSGFTTMEDSTFSDLLKHFNVSFPDFVSGFGGFPLPGYALEARLGGIFLPFDVGVKFGYLPLKPDYIDNLDYLLVGADVRFALLEDKLIFPAVSVGVGFNHISGGIGKSIGKKLTFSYEPGKSIEVDKPKVTVDWSTTTLDFKAQISKSLIILTPYLGVGASYGKSEAGYGVNTKKASIPEGEDIEAVKVIMKKYGIDNFDEKNGFSSRLENDGWGFRTYAGLSFNIVIFRIDLTVLYNFANSYGITLGTRLQI